MKDRRSRTVLALSGSLRAASINSAFCRTVVRVAPAPLKVNVFDGLEKLPLFNPDLEPYAPEPVRALRSSIGTTDAVLIASPEYAHGISGPLKNALDWLVSCERLTDKPVAIVNMAPRARHADESLREVLRTMSMTIIASASLSISLPRTCVTEEAMLSSPDVRRAILDILAAVSEHLQVQQ